MTCVTEYSDLFLNLVSRMGEKFGIVLVLVNPAWREKFCDDSCIFFESRVAREVWGSSYAILALTVHFYCVMVIKHSMS
jgi:hypothetical protein